MLKAKTIALVADGEKALFLRNAGTKLEPQLEPIRVETQELEENREVYTDRAGRMYDGGKEQKSAMEQTDYKQIERGRFAEEMAGILSRMLQRKDFERLIIAAPPSVLGELRPRLHKTVEAAVVAEVAKDFTNMPIGEVQNKLFKSLENGDLSKF